MLLLLSNSSSDAGYLAHALDWIADAVGDAETLAFVPYAGVTVSFDAYAERVREALAPLGRTVRSVHEAEAPERAVAEADAVLVGGGNTFALLRRMARRGLLEAVRRHVRAGGPYVGWSAGSNVACPSIRTTNDMPIVEPPGFGALGLVPFQINPHYADAHPPGHRGETRAERLAEFVAANPDVPVVGLPEGTALRVAGAQAQLLGTAEARAGARLFDAAAAHGRPLTDGDLEALLDVAS